MTNPFEDEDGQYLVLVNDEGQHSLWPVWLDVPPGWTVAHTADSRAASLAWVDENWTDLRPLSLIRAEAQRST